MGAQEGDGKGRRPVQSTVAMQINPTMRIDQLMQVGDGDCEPVRHRIGAAILNRCAPKTDTMRIILGPELLEVEAGMYEGLRPNEERYFLQNAAVAAASRDRPADDMFGEWAFVRGSGTGKPICAITLANSAADADNFAINVKPGCDQLITRFGPAAWRMDRGQLVVQSGKGEIWRFEESDPNTWKRIPEVRQPLALVRQ